MDARIPVGSGKLTPSLARTAKNPQTQRKWQVVRSFTTSIFVIRQFGKKYCTKKIQLSQQDLFEKTNVSESASTTNQPAGSASASEAPFSPQRCHLAQDGFNRTMSKFPTSEPPQSKTVLGFQSSLLKACKIFEGSSAWPPILLLFSLQYLEQEVSPEELNAGLIVLTVLLIGFTHEMEGTTATDLVRLILQFASKNKLLVFGSIIVLKIGGARAQSPIETGNVEPDGSEMIYYVTVAAFTILIIWLTFVDTRNMIDRQHPVAVAVAVPAPVMPAGLPANDFIMEVLQRTDYRRTNSTLAIPSEI